MEFVIAMSTVSYEEAHRVALEASHHLGLPLDLRDLHGMSSLLVIQQVVTVTSL
jgi:hypothetical protein